MIQCRLRLESRLTFSKKRENNFQGKGDKVLYVLKESPNLKSINQSINVNLNSHKRYFYSVEKEK